MKANCPLRQGALISKEHCHGCRHYERGEELWIWHCRAPKRAHAYIPVSYEIAEENVAKIKEMLLKRKKEEDNGKDENEEQAIRSEQSFIRSDGKIER